jgi:hypothetical protein
MKLNIRKPQNIFSALLILLPAILRWIDIPDQAENLKKLPVVFSIIFGLIWVFIVFGHKLIKDNRIIKRKENLTILELSILFFVAGTYFSLMLIFPAFDPAKPSIAMYIFLSPFAFIALSFMYLLTTTTEESHESRKASEKTYLMLNRDGITNLDLLSKALKKHNSLVAIGNLMNLKTTIASKLLKQYLQQNSHNHIHLVIPKDSFKYLREIRKNINDDNLIKTKLKIISIYPFVQMQGLLIVGDLHDDDLAIKGYFKYKTNLKEDENLTENGIYVDLSDDVSGLLSEPIKKSMELIFNLLQYGKYNYNPSYEITHKYMYNNGKYSYRMKMANPMCFYCDFEDRVCSKCPIYSLNVDAEKVKVFFGNKNKSYIAGQYDAITSEN